MSDADELRAMERLPKWAQRRIEDQAKQIAALTNRIAELSEGPADADVIEHDYLHPPRPIGKGKTIRFVMNDRGEYIEIHHARNNSGYLELRGAGGQAAGSLAVQPQVSNVLRIRLDRHW